MKLAARHRRRREVLALLHEQGYRFDQLLKVLNHIFVRDTADGCPHVRADDRGPINRILAGY